MGDIFKPGTGYWEAIIHPTEYIGNRFRDQVQLQESIQKSKVYLRGWDFPHTDTHGNSSNFNRGFQSITQWSRYREGYRAYLSGLFTYKQMLWEDTEGMSKRLNQPALGFVNSIWSVLEFFLFFKRFYETIPIDNLWFTIHLNNTNGRKIFADDPHSILLGAPESKESTIIVEESIKAVELKTNPEEIAAKVTKRIFLVFNLNIDISQIFIWQEKLKNRQ